ncbi:SBBP repeat-containing protein [Pyxidicoccus sp. 3LFB2]
MHPTVACSGETCRGFQSVDLARVQQGLSTVNYSTYVGFAGHDEGGAVAVDAGGNAYVIGSTNSFGGTSNVFVAKLSPTGQLLYFTYFTGNRYGLDIAVDTSGSAYIVAGAGQWPDNGMGSIAAKLNPSGSAFTYYNNVPWFLTAIAVDSLGNAYVTGEYPGVSGADVSVSKFNASGSALLYSVSFGGGDYEIPRDIAVDSSGNAYVVGWTQSPNFPVWNAIQASRPGPKSAFVSKLNAAGTGLAYSTYLGSFGYQTLGWGIALDNAGNAYVVGETGPNFPVTASAAQTFFGGGLDGYVARLSASGGLAYASYLGGSGSDRAGSVAVDRNSGTAYVAGDTESSNFPVTSSAFQPTYRGGTDAFMTQVRPSGNAFSYSTYLGGSGVDVWGRIALDASLKVYVTGTTFSNDFPTNVYGYGGSADAFITRFNGP